MEIDEEVQGNTHVYHGKFFIRVVKRFWFYKAWHYDAMKKGLKWELNMIIGELCTFPHFLSLQHSKHHILLLLLPKIIERGGAYSFFWKKFNEKLLYLPST